MAHTRSGTSSRSGWPAALPGGRTGARVGGRVSAAVARRLAGGVPVTTAGRRARRSAASDRTVREVLELAVRCGEAMLSLGAAAADVVEAIRTTCAAWGVEVQVDVTFTAILVAADGDDDAPGTSVLRVVQVRASDYDRLGRVSAVVEDVAARRSADRPVDRSADRSDPGAHERVLAELEAAHARLDGVLTEPQRYRPALVTASLAAMAAGVALLLGGGPLVVVLAAATTGAVDVVLRWLGRWGLPAFFLQVAGAAVVTTVAVLLLEVVPGLPVELTALPPSLVVGSGIVVLLAGMSMVGAADDAINGYPVTASGRLLEVLLLTLGLVVGIGGVLDLARRAGTQLDLFDTGAAAWSLPVQVLGAALASAGWACSCFAGPRTAAVAAAAGGGAWLVHAALTGAGLPTAVAGAVGALLVGAAAERTRRLTGVPVTVMTSCGIVPLLPGLAIYEGMLDLVTGSETGGRLMEAAVVGVGLAAGATLGRTLAARAGALRRRHPAPPQQTPRHASEGRQEGRALGL